MSGHQPGKGPKIMSSRLMTMKFMQRAAASSPTATPSTPEQSSPKRRKTSGHSTPDAPASELQAIQAVLAEEEAKRLKAVERQGAEAGESRWVLSFKDSSLHGDGRGPSRRLQVVDAGYATIDEATRSSVQGDPDGNPRTANVGRRTFGRLQRSAEASEKQEEDSSPSASDHGSPAFEDGDEEDDDDPSGARALIRASRAAATERARADRRAQRKAAKAESTRLAEERRGKTVKLNKLTSISGGGGTTSSSRAMECYNCGVKGHRASECPTPDKKRGRPPS
ncbi:MAG: hypothetical protein M1832_004211 [Thelocarpon impressellum]|nr:MAG: hypothetical protein M1832_004211 [Thelocarpon impressellum]